MSESLRLGGITLAQYAGVSAATAEEIPLAEVLAQEKIPPNGWPDAERAWREAIAKGPDLLMQFMELKRKAEDALTRKVEPIDSDPSAWAGLLAGLALGGDAAKLLAALGLRSPDVARIGRAWNERAKADPQVSKDLAAAAGKSGPPTSVRAEPVRLKPFPWSPNAKAKGPSAAPAPIAATAAAPTASDGVLALRTPREGALPITFDADLFAALDVALELAPDRRAKALALCGLDEARYADVDASWNDRMKKDPELRATCSVKSADHRAALRRLLHGARGVIAGS